VPQPTIAAIESGRQDPRFETLRMLVEHCGRELTTLPRAGIGVDRSQIHELLRLTPGQRLRSAGENANAMRQLLRSRR
jgi:predicted transcriptional regulator